MKKLTQAVICFMLFFTLTAGVKASFHEFSFDLNAVQLSGDQYGDVLKIDGCHLTGAPGDPFMPVKAGQIAAPFGTIVTGIRIVDETWVLLPGSYDIRPAPTQVPISYTGPMPEVFRSPEVYSSDEPYPSEALIFSGGGTMRGYSLGGFMIYPLRYYPALGKVEVLEKLVVQVEYTSAYSTFSPTIEFGTVVSKLVENPSEVQFQSLILSPVDPNDVKYLIITSSGLAPSFQPLADWYTQSGWPAEIVAYSTIQNNYSGQTDQLKTKACIYDYAVNKGTIFVLLGGDDTVIPDQNCLAEVGGNIDNSMPTDLFFACFDNEFDWNSDGDNRVGELTDGIDLYPELFISRAPVRTPEHTTNFVNKTLNYILNQPADSFVDPMLLTGLELWETWQGRSDADWRCERLWNVYAAPAWPGHTRVRLYDTNTDFGGAGYDVTYQNLSTVLNGGYSYFFMATHGGQTTWSMETGSSFSSSHALALTNSSQQGVIYTIACITNAFDMESGYSSDPCLSEGFIRNGNGGAVAYQGCSRYGWGRPGQSDEHGVSFQYADEFFTYLFSGNSYEIPSGYPYRLGAAAASHKAAKVPECNDGVVRWVNYGTNSIGDPGMDLFTENPLAMNPGYDDSVYLGPSNFTVSNLPIDARVCLWKGSEVYAVGMESSGSVTLPILPTSTSMMKVTVTAHNYNPHVGEVQPVIPQTPCVVYDTFTVNDINGDNNGLVDFGENILLGMQLENIGIDTAYNVSATISSDDPNVAITDNFESFGTIIGDFGQVNIADAFAFDASIDIPDGHIIPFEIEIAGSSIDPITNHFIIYAHAPDVGILEVIVDDASGNGNGMLDANETVEVYITLLNNGSTQAGMVSGSISENDEHVSITDADATFGSLTPSGGTGSNWDNALIIVADSSFPTGYSVSFDLAIEAEGGYTKDLCFTLQSLESFETSDAGWTGEVIWEWGTPTSGPNEAYDGENVWATVLDGNYPYNSDYGLVTPYYTIADPNAMLSFYHWYSTQAADGGNVLVSSDGGWTWELVIPQSGYSRPSVNSLNGQPGFSGESVRWQPVVIDLSEYFDQTIKIKFRFGSDSFVNRAGWYIDGIVFHGGSRWEPDDLPSASCNHTFCNLHLIQGTTHTVPITLSNDGPGILDFTASIDAGGRILAVPSGNGLATDMGGPDDFGYIWKDSNEPDGPVYNWVDITLEGTQIDSLDDDINIGPIDIGFDFPFYGNSFDAFKLCSNGFISFTSIYANAFNRCLPSNGIEPFNLVAPFWDNLNFQSGGQAYYYSSAESLIVSYIDVPLFSVPGSAMTFQLILLENGEIIFQYANLNGATNSATIGIQNQNGSVGTQIAYNEDYVEDNLAVRIIPPIFWLAVSPGCGMVFPDGSFDIGVTFDAIELDIDQYFGRILITTDDPDNPSFDIACTLTVGITDIDDEYMPAIPVSFALEQNYPNPFNSSTEISFGLPAPGYTTLDIYDIMGRKVKTILNEDLPAGFYKITWDGADRGGKTVASGMYFYRLSQNDHVCTKKMLLLK